MLLRYQEGNEKTVSEYEVHECKEIRHSDRRKMMEEIT